MSTRAQAFDERTPTVEVKTPWGWWSQTHEEVTVVVYVPQGTVGREVRVAMLPTSVCVSTVKATAAGGSPTVRVLLEGPLHATIVVDESTWTLEESREVRLVLVKSNRSASATWPCLIQG